MLLLLQSFYAIYREVFKTIAEEDREYVDLKEGEEYSIPEFGSANSDYDEARHFCLFYYWKVMHLINAIN